MTRILKGILLFGLLVSVAVLVAVVSAEDLPLPSSTPGQEYTEMMAVGPDGTIVFLGQPSGKASGWSISSPTAPFQTFLPVMARPAPSAGPGFVNVIGQVIDTSTGQGLPDAYVSFSAVTTQSNGKGIQVDASGRYQITLAQDKYDLLVTNYPVWGGPFSHTQHAMVGIDVSATNSVFAPDVLMDPNDCAVSGRLTNAVTGLPITGSNTQVYVRLGNSQFRNVWFGINASYPDSQGYYSMRLASRTYQGFSVYSPQYNSAWSNGSVTCSPGETKTLNFALQPK